MQGVRREIVHAILNNRPIMEESVNVLRKTYGNLTDPQTKTFVREMASPSGERFEVNVRDEIVGLQVH